MARTRTAGAVKPIHLDNSTRRNDDEILHGQFARIERGPHRYEIGVLLSTVEADEDGYPEVVMLELRNTGRQVVVPYADLTPTRFGGR